MKSQAQLEKKHSFFQEVSYSIPSIYENKFDEQQNEIVRAENQEIESILKSNIPESMSITDIGCGSGLGRRMLKNEDYTGVDMLKEAVEYCQEHYKGTFIQASAEDYIKLVEKINPIFLFSIDYVDLESIEEYLIKTGDIFIAVHYNEPYKSETSVYSGNEDKYRELHPIEQVHERLLLFDRYNAVTYRLLDQNYYYVTILDKRKS